MGDRGCCVAAFGLVLLTTSPGDALYSFFNLWSLPRPRSCSPLGGSSRGVRTRSRRPHRLDRDHGRHGLHGVRGGLRLRPLPLSESVARRPRLDRLLPAPVRGGMVLLIHPRASSIAGALWLDGRPRRSRRRRSALRSWSSSCCGSANGSPSAVVGTLPSTGPRPPARRRCSASSRSRTGGRGRRWLVLGLGVLATTIADAVYLFQSTAGDVSARDAARFSLAGLDAAHRLGSGWIDNGDERGLAVAGTSAARLRATRALVSIGTLVDHHFGGANALAVLLATATLLAVLMRLAATFRQKPAALRPDASGGRSTRRSSPPDASGREPPVLAEGRGESHEDREKRSPSPGAWRAG